MKFKYSCFTENTPEIREWLEKIGYKHGYTWSEDSTIIFAVMGSFCIDREDAIRRYLGIYGQVSDCRSNPELFKALTAVRDDSNYLQWFVTDYDSWYLCTDEYSWNLCKRAWHKATLAELQEHFKKK